MNNDRPGVHEYAEVLAGIGNLDVADRPRMLLQLLEIRLLPETLACPRVEQDWGRSA